ncbi:MAG TPA: helix-turn-helix transcriptional regulator [Bryobacteraceae bacterium]|nr:helix-turn-helix transcriptional regulator [Bryobacteraceae bacterium]
MESIVLAQGQWPAAGFFSAEQDIRNGVDWTIHRDTDTVVVHLEGPVNHLETEQEGCGAALGPPMPGELWIIPAGSRYSAQAKGGRIRYAELHFRPAALSSPISARAGHYDAFFHQAALRLESLAARQDDLSRLTAETLSFALQLDFYQRFGGAAFPEPHRSPRFLAAEQKRIESHIEQHLDSPLRLPALAALAGRTSHDFLIAFRASFGTTPAQYIIEQRLRRAQRLLANSSKDITAVALESGFSSHAHFSSAFRARLGVTPREFRRLAPRGLRVW